MSKTLAKLFPLLDYLYIYQLHEYDSWALAKWFLNHPLSRNLQKKHQVILTSKALLILVTTLSLLIFTSLLLSKFLIGNFLLSILFFILLVHLSPIYLVISKLILYPLERYQKQKILNLAKNKLSKMPDLKVVAITGSYGKTSTKDILYTLLWKKYYVVKTPKSFNTPLGVSQTILEDVKANTDIFIAEVGAYKKGEIKKIANLITPQIGIITAIAPQHLERFKTIENIAYAKFELVESLPKNGLAILNSASEWLKKLWPNSPCTVSFYGYDSDYKVQNIKLSLSGTSFQLLTPKGKADINIPLIGEHHAYNFLAAAVAALKLGISLDEIKSRAGLLLPTPHRMEIKSLGNITLIDNSFNSNSESAKSSLSLLGSFDDTKKIVVTPGFVELGKESSVRNRAFGEDIAKVADEIIIVGENAKEDLLRGVQKVFRSEETIHFAASTQDALVLAQQLMQGTKGVVLLENDLPDQYN